MIIGYLFFVMMMTTATQTKTLSAVRVDESSYQDDILLTESIMKAKSVYGEDIVLVLVSPSDINQELAHRPDMAQFMPDTTKQIMKISTLNALQDTFNCHETITVDGSVRSQWVPWAKTFYSIADGRILAINPTQESLERFVDE